MVTLCIRSCGSRHIRCSCSYKFDCRHNRATILQLNAMKKLAIILMWCVLKSFSLDAQIFDPERPMIMPFTICADSINSQMHDPMRKPHHPKLTIDGGWVQIPNSYYRHNGKSMGIIIVQDFTYTYHAYDARCPHCYYDNQENSKMKMWTPMSAICPECDAQAENIINWGSGQLTGYNHGILGPQYMNGYSVRVVKKGKKTYLRISNTPNGAGNEWQELPENQFLINHDL